MAVGNLMALNSDGVVGNVRVNPNDLTLKSKCSRQPDGDPRGRSSHDASFLVADDPPFLKFCSQIARDADREVLTAGNGRQPSRVERRLGLPLFVNPLHRLWCVRFSVAQLPILDTPLSGEFALLR